MSRTSRFFLWAIVGSVAVAAVALGGAALWMRSVDSDPADWHVDLTRIARTGNPNDYLAATPGYTAAEADRSLPPAADPGTLLERIDRIALAEPRTSRLAGTPAEGRMTYVQRSAGFGFPDYITVQATADGWAIWSRARFGTSDLGVNRQRVERWLAALDRLS